MTHTIGGICEKALRAASLRAAAVVWLAAAVMLALAIQDRIYILVDLIILGFVALGAGILSVRRELLDVHRLVNSQHDELVARVEQLTDALEEHGLPVPEPKPVLIHHYGGLR